MLTWSGPDAVCRCGTAAGIAAGRVAFALFAGVLLAACSTPAPPATPPDSVPDSDSARVQAQVDTYFEGSRRVWEAARDRGVLFRAVGQEPGWVLEIAERTMTLIMNYGADTLAFPVPQPAPDPDTRVVAYHARTQAHDLHVSIREEPCSDTMSGERFSVTVQLVLNDTTYAGCGRSLARLP